MTKLQKRRVLNVVLSVIISVLSTYWILIAWSGLTASDGDTLTALKWNELVSLVNWKANSSDVYTKTELYTKTEIDAKGYLTSSTWWGVQLSTTCTTSTPWVMNYDTTNHIMSVCMDWEWVELVRKPAIKSCKDILDNWKSVWDGTYTIDPLEDWTWFQVYCDMTTAWGGWTAVISVSPSSRNHLTSFACDNSSKCTSDKAPWVLSSTNYWKYSDSIIKTLLSTWEWIQRVDWPSVKHWYKFISLSEYSNADSARTYSLQASSDNWLNWTASYQVNSHMRWSVTSQNLAHNNHWNLDSNWIHLGWSDTQNGCYDSHNWRSNHCMVYVR